MRPDTILRNVLQGSYIKIIVMVFVFAKQWMSDIITLLYFKEVSYGKQ